MLFNVTTVFYGLIWAAIFFGVIGLVAMKFFGGSKDYYDSIEKRDPYEKRLR